MVERPEAQVHCSDTLETASAGDDHAPLPVRTVPSIVLYGFKWEAKISEGQGDTTASRPLTRDLHHRKKFLQLAIREAAEVNGKVPVGFVEHSRPSGPMEERASGVR
jgi:hypothetical protein